MSQLISVCIPVYNGEKYLAQTLDSILGQTHREIEVVISDNASSDKTPGIIESYARRDSRIVSHRNAENLGYCRNIWGAVSRASSDIVAIYHADDVYHPSIVSRELRILEAEPAIGGVFALPAVFTRSPAHAGRRPFYTGLATHGPYRQDLRALVGGYEDYLPLLLEFGNIFACPSFMTRKHIFIEQGGFSDLYPSNEDLELWIKYLKAGQNLAIVNDFLLNYRMSDSHASAYWRAQPELAVMYRVLDEMIVVQRALSDSEWGLYRKNRAVGYARAAVNASALGNGELANELASKSYNEARLSPITPWGLAQRMPRVFSTIQRLICRMRVN
jgi:glycosyltransferase involved in cell wall biosynthesis